MKIAVLGSTGMAGHVVSQYLTERGHLVFRASRSEENTDTSASIDITDFVVLSAWLNSIGPDVVINCVGLLQRACEEHPDQAILVNSYLPHWLEQRYAAGKTKVIHLSTDCVFSGKRGGYREGDTPDGETTYDRSKAMGELCNGKDLTFRMSILGPDIDPRGIGLFNWFMSQRGMIQGYSKTIWNGVTTIELARAIEAAITQNLKGLYHLVQPSPIDKCSLLELIQEVFDYKELSIERVDGPLLNKSLINTRDDFDFEVRDYLHQIADMRAWIEGHKSLYPHYFR